MFLSLCQLTIPNETPDNEPNMDFRILAMDFNLTLCNVSLILPLATLIFF